jgi:Apea-like HEPN
MERSIYFIANPINCNFNLPVEIANGLWLRKANTVEINAIENHPNQIRNHTLHGVDILWFVTKTVRLMRNELGHRWHETEPLEEADYRYFVFDLSHASSVENAVSWDLISKNELALRYAMILSTIPFNSILNFRFTHNGDGVFFETSPIFHFVHFPVLAINSSNPDKLFDCKNFSEEDALHTGKIFELIRGFNSEKYTFIQESIESFYDLQSLLKYSSFYTLSLFTIIERLLTNDGYGKSGSPSISWQLKGKIDLINNMLDDPIDFHSYFQFGDTSTKTVIEKLYKIRSKIAHGEKIDYADSDLSLRNNFFIKSRDLLNDFLFDFTRKILYFSIKNPKFISDLREC